MELRMVLFEAVVTPTYRQWMGRVDEYHRRALEADRRARAAISRSARAEFERVAINWRDLARQAAVLEGLERQEDSPAGKPA